MPPLPENNTDRLWIDYSDGLNPHSLQIRYDATVVERDVVRNTGRLFLEAIAPQLYLITITGVRYSLKNSNVSLPMPWAGATTFGTGAMPGAKAPYQICYLSRDAQGRRTRWFMFGCKLDTPNTFRFPLSANVELAEGWGVINDGQPNGIWLSIAGLDPEMYSYISVNFNNYYEQKTRP